jgi:hypothetical protein
MRPSRTRLAGTLAILLLAVAALAWTGCGDDDDDSAGTGSTQQQAEGDTGGGNGGGDGDAQAGGGGDAGGGSASGDQSAGGAYRPPPGSEEEGAYESVTGTYDALGGDEIDTTSVCELMTDEARQQTVEYARRSSGIAKDRWTCDEAVTLLVDRSKRLGGFKRTLEAEVIGVNVDGDRATATVRFGKKGAATALPLVKEDGEWKLGSAPGGTK